MGSKGSATTSQTQTYAPAGAGYVQNALNMAGSAAQTPFNMPLQQTAGLTDQQNQAFGAFGQAYNSAQPYYQQANNLYGQSANTNVNQYLNPYIDQVTAQMNNVFGQQQAQTTGQLTQAAGGVGADRIAVGQSQLANQQALAAGQTYSGIYQNALSAAQNQQGLLQNAASGTASLGANAQNSALSGAQALYGSGAAQQTQQQNINNAQYQYQLQQAQFPYQQANFYGGLVGALAPGLGGTTSGQSTSTPAQPSIWSQLLGAGVAGTGAVGATGGFGANGYLSNAFGSSPSYGGGNMFSGDAYGGSSANPTSGLSASDYGSGYAEGGVAQESGEQPFIPTANIKPIQTQAPQLNFSSGQQQSGGSGGINVGDIAKMAMMFAKDGGSIPFAKTFDGHDPYTFFRDRFPREGYDGGGTVDDPFGDDRRKVAYDLLRQSNGTQAPESIPGGESAPEPFRMPDQASVDRWRSGVSQDMAAGNTAQGSDAPTRALAFTPDKSGATGLPAEVLTGQSSAYAPQRPEATPGASSGETPFNIPLTQGGQERKDSFANSPWAALMQAGLGIMGGTSPFAGVNIGQGGMQGLKTLQQQQETAQKDETIAQSAKRLAQEAKFHEDQYTRMTPYQKAEIGMQQSRDKLARDQFDRPYKELTKMQQETVDRQKEQDDLAQEKFDRPYNQLTAVEKAQLEQQRLQHDQSAVGTGMKPKYDENGKLIGSEPLPGGQHDPAQIRSEADAKRLPAMNREDMAPMVDAYLAGDHSVMNGVGRGAQGPQNIQQFWNMISEKLTAQGADGKQIAAAKANFMGQQAALRTAATRAANIDTAVNEAKGTFPEVLRTSSLLPRSEFTPFNQALEYFRSKTGSPEQRQYGAAMQAAVTAYSQAMSRTGVNSVYAQQHASEILAKADGPKAIEASIKQLEREMQIAKTAPEETRRAIVNNILGRPMEEGEGAQPGQQPQNARSPQDQQALEWASANPNDPRAAAIKKRLGVQ